MCPALAAAGSMLPPSTAFSREPRESRATSRLDSSQLVRNFETRFRIRVCLQAYRNSMKNVSGFSRCGLDVATVNRIFPRPRESRATSRLDFVSGYAFRHTVIRAKNVSGFSRCGLDVATVNRIFPRTSRVAGNVETRFVSGYAFRHTVIP